MAAEQNDTGSASGLRELIRKFALKNAIDFGSAIEAAVLGKVLAADPALRAETAQLSILVKKQIAEVNKLSKAELKREFSKYAGEFKVAQEKRAEKSAKHSFEIAGAVQGNFATRFPPEPGGYIHIGHAKALFIEDTLRRKYNGKLMLYFDDTNPDIEKQEFIDAIHEDLAWLGVKFDGEYYASDHMQQLYDYAKSVISKGKAYVCTCRDASIRNSRFSGVACGHKAQSVSRNLELWQEMLNGKFGGGEAVLRLYSDMRAVNTTMRDPTLFRIKRTKHYRQGDKYIVWPTYDFNTPIIDSVEGITDALRDKNYELRDELYFMILDLLGLRKPRVTSFARLDIANNITSKRKIRALIAEKRISGWDDPRLVTIRALRRRGITIKAIREFALSGGMGKAESTVRIDALLRINRKVLDPVAKRLFFIENPVEMSIGGLDSADSEVSLKLHPTADLGSRKYRATGTLCISAKDAAKLKEGDVIRLKEAYNVKIVKKSQGAIAAAYVGKEGPASSVPRLRWISKADMVPCKLWDIGEPLVKGEFNDFSITKHQGYAEGYAKELSDGAIVQFEGHGIYKLDDKGAMRFLSL